MRENNNNNKHPHPPTPTKTNKQTNQKDRVSEVRSVTDVAQYLSFFWPH